jgi:uncharacterized protein
MKFIDSHVHMDSIERFSLESMALSGITTLIADAAPMPGLAPKPESVFDFIERNLGYETIRASEFFIDLYFMVGINMFFVPADYRRVLEALPNYFSDKRIVALGEIGLEPRSQTCPDMKVQEEIVKVCFSIAREHNKAVFLHTPVIDREKWITKYFKIAEEKKVDPSRVIISHMDYSTIKQVTEYGCIADITVQPWRKISAEYAAKALEGVDLERVIIDSDSSLRFGSDVLSIPKTALEMKRVGFSELEIEKVLYDNPARIFGLEK